MREEVESSKLKVESNQFVSSRAGMAPCAKEEKD
jgi:hypothetical protein